MVSPKVSGFMRCECLTALIEELLPEGPRTILVFGYQSGGSAT